MTLKFNVFLQKTIAMRSIILLKIVMVAIISVVYIASSCTKNTSSNSRIDQVCDNFNSVSDTAHRDSSNFLTQLGISPDTITFDDIKKFEHNGGFYLDTDVADKLIGNYIYQDIWEDSLGCMGNTLIGVIPIYDNCLIGAYRIDDGDGQNIYLISHDKSGKVQDCIFTGYNWGYGATFSNEAVNNVEQFYSDDTECKSMGSNRFAVINTYIKGEHNIQTDMDEELFRRVNMFEYTITPDGIFHLETKPCDFTSALVYDEIQLCDTLFLYYDYYLRFPMSDSSVYDLWNEVSLKADASLSTSLSWHIRELLNRNSPQLLEWMCRHKGEENLSTYLYNEFISDEELRSKISELPNQYDRLYLEGLLFKPN